MTEQQNPAVTVAVIAGIFSILGAVIGLGGQFVIGWLSERRTRLEAAIRREDADLSARRQTCRAVLDCTDWFMEKAVQATDDRQATQRLLVEFHGRVRQLWPDVRTYCPDSVREAVREMYAPLRQETIELPLVGGEPFDGPNWADEAYERTRRAQGLLEADLNSLLTAPHKARV